MILIEKTNGHRRVCSLSHTFLKVQEQVDKIMVGSEEDNGTTRIVDISWLDIRVNCVHRIPNTNPRSKFEGVETDAK